MPYNSYSDDGEYEISNIKRSEAGGFFRGHHTDKQLQEEVQKLVGVLKEIINDHFSLRGTVYSARNLMRKAEDIIHNIGE